MSVRRLTGAGPGAVAVLEVLGAEGPDRLSALSEAPLPRPGRLRLTRLRAGEEVLDEALVVGLASDRFELHLHGGPAVVARVAEELGGLGAEGAPRTLEARARALLPDAPSEDGARILLDQAQGALRHELERIVGLAPLDGRRALEALVEAGRLALPLLRAPRVVLAGPTNAGKSTLFNLLVGTERALTSGTHGTTRDALVERGRLGRLVVEWVDTAGEREGAAGAVERAGQGLARSLRTSADLCLWLTPDGQAGPSGTHTLARGPGPASTRPPTVATLEDPEGTRAVVRELVEHALPHAPWEAGRPVPFDPTLHGELADLVPMEHDERAGRLERLLADHNRSHRSTAR